MKSINNYISEKLVINRNTKLQYEYFPKTKEELQDIIEQRIEEDGNECNLNDIDVSKITDMSYLFIRQSNFNGDISEWDVHNVEIMQGMFERSTFNGDISNWDVSNVNSMYCMFYHSKFNKDISKWDVSNVEIMSGMFEESNFNQDISNWDVSNVKYINNIFYHSPLQDKEKEWWNK